MLNSYEQETKPMSANRTLWLGFSAAVLIVLGCVGWIFYSRLPENRAINEDVKAQKQEREHHDAAAHGQQNQS